MALPASVSVQIKANGVDVSGSIDWSSIDLTLVLTKEVSSCKFNVQNPGATLPGGGTKYVPQPGDVIGFYETSNDGSGNVTSHIFGGTITEIETVVAGGILQLAQVTVTDWGYTMDGRLVVKSYANMDPTDIVADIVANYCPAGFDASTYVQRVGYDIASIKFNYEQPTKCLQALASQIGWEWYVDGDKFVHFFLAESLTAPFAIDDTSNAIDWNTLDVDVNLQNMKNSVFVIGGVYDKDIEEANAVDVYLGDGTQRTWTITYPYTSSTITIKKGGVVQAIGIANQVTDPTLYDVIYDASNRIITFTIAPGASVLVEVYGVAEIPIVGHAIDQHAIAIYGEFQDAIFDAQIKSISEAQQRAQAEILLYGHAVYDVKFYTTTPGLRIGQTIMFNSAQFNASNIPLVVKRIEGKGRGPFGMRYQVECVGSDNVTFVDIMSTILQKENSDTQTDNTVLEVLLSDIEALAVVDALSNPIPKAGPYVYAPDWSNRVPVTVNHGQVGGAGTISGFPVRIDLSLFPASFFGIVKSDGSDIRVYQSDNATQMPCEVVSIDTVGMTGELWIKGDISALTDTTFYVWYGNPNATMPLSTDTFGSQAVWVNFTDVYHLKGNALDSATANKPGTLFEATQASDSVQFLGEQQIGGNITGTTSLPFGQSTLGNQKIAQSFTVTATLAAQLDVLLRKMTTTGTLSTGANYAIQADSAGVPSGTNITSGTFVLNGTGAPPVGTDVVMISNAAATSLAIGTTYWLVLSMTSNSDTNYPNVAYDPAASYGVLKSFNGTSWSTVTGSLRVGIYKSGYVRFSSSISLAFHAVAIYFRLKKVDNTYEAIVANSVGNTTTHIEINRTANNNISARDSGGTEYDFATGITTSDGTYHDYLYVADGTNVRWYIDGVAVTGQTAWPTNAAQVFQFLGAIQNRLNSTYGQALKGNLQDVMFMAPATAVTDVNWALTRRHNANSIGTFLTIGAQDTALPNVGVYNFSTWS